MDKRRFLKLALGVGAAGLTMGLGGCVVPAPLPPGAGPVRPYDYYYYPDVNVYFAIASGFYYYPYRGRWFRRRRLPRHIVLTPRYRRPIFVGHPRPYRLNRRHLRRYGRGPFRPYRGRRGGRRRRP